MRRVVIIGVQPAATTDVKDRRVGVGGVDGSVARTVEIHEKKLTDGREHYKGRSKVLEQQLFDRLVPSPTCFQGLPLHELLQSSAS